MHVTVAWCAPSGEGKTSSSLAMCPRVDAKSEIETQPYCDDPFVSQSSHVTGVTRGGAWCPTMRSLTERMLLCVFLGVIAGALVAMFGWGGVSDAGALDSATAMGWFPENLRQSGDVKQIVTYRRDAIAAATEEWRATVRRTGHADAFGLDDGPLGGGGEPGFGRNGERT